MDSTEMPTVLVPDREEEPSWRERRAARVEDFLDIPMALLALLWAILTAWEIVASRDIASILRAGSYAVWGIFWAEFLFRLFLSGHPLRFLRRHWPGLIFLVLPALRLFRLFRAFRVLRLLPATRVIGSSYRAVGTARALLEGRLGFLIVATGIAVFGSGQLFFLLERTSGTVASLGDAFFWSASLAVGNNLVLQPQTIGGRLLALLLSAYSVVVFASVAATLGAFFVESRAERAASEEERPEPSVPDL